MTGPVLPTAYVVKIDDDTGRIPEALLPTSVGEAATAAHNAAVAAEAARDATALIKSEAADILARVRRPKVTDIDAVGDISDDQAHTKVLFGNGEWRAPVGSGGSIGMDDVIGLNEALEGLDGVQVLHLSATDPVPPGTPSGAFIIRDAQ